MRPCYAALCLFVLLAPLTTINAQVATPLAFLEQTQTAALDGKTITSVKLSGTAQWVAGSTHESGNAELSANTDGSSSVQLSLSKASRTDTQTKTDFSKTCQWTDAAGTARNVLGLNCFVAIPWFAPILFTQSPTQLPALLTMTDDGQVVKDGVTLHQISYRLALKTKDDASTKRLQDGTAVKVFFDPTTFLPSSLEYSTHPGDNDLRSIDTKIVFSDYRSTNGVMLPFHIEKYMQRTLQLTLDISNATIE